MSKKKVRAGHRGFLTGTLLPEVDAGLEDTTTGKVNLVTWKETLKEQLEKIVPLDEAILAELVEKEVSSEDDITDKIQRAARLKADVIKRLVTIEERPTTSNVEPSDASESAAVSPPPTFSQNLMEENAENAATSPGTSIFKTSNQSKKALVKLPKLEVRKFGGKLEEWQQFWDSFESVIHCNESLSEVDKFSYLRGLLVGPARSAIAGRPRTTSQR